MRDKLIELFEDVNAEWDRYLDNCLDEGKEPEQSYYEFQADHLLSNGVIVLPCKVGDTVYKTVRTFDGGWAIWEIRIEHITLYLGAIGGRDLPPYAIGETQDGTATTIYLETIGKTVFLTREEAEAALKEAQK